MTARDAMLPLRHAAASYRQHGTICIKMSAARAPASDFPARPVALRVRTKTPNIVRRSPSGKTPPRGTKLANTSAGNEVASQPTFWSGPNTGLISVRSHSEFSEVPRAT